MYGVCVFFYFHRRTRRTKGVSRSQQHERHGIAASEAWQIKVKQCAFFLWPDVWCCFYKLRVLQHEKGEIALNAKWVQGFCTAAPECTQYFGVHCQRLHCTSLNITQRVTVIFSPLGHLLRWWRADSGGNYPHFSMELLTSSSGWLLSLVWRCTANVAQHGLHVVPKGSAFHSYTVAGSSWCRSRHTKCWSLLSTPLKLDMLGIGGSLEAWHIFAAQHWGA